VAGPTLAGRGERLSVDAMLLAAGLGTRLRPLTDHTPKALIEVGGAPILERIALRLVAVGADRLIINLHHLGGQIERYVAERGGWGVEVVFSEEAERPLETGGGLLHARRHFRGDAPFFLHNTDILTDFDLRALYEAHCARADALATLATMERTTTRFLLFDDMGLCGRTDESKGLELRARPAAGEVRRLAFGGVHVVDPRIFDLLTEQGAFSILDPYLRLVGEGQTVLPHRIDGARWLDIGKPEQLERARAEF
jgi:N-acetyl-alpha-D-muramate 1-phosphate uridylyltransferase